MSTGFQRQNINYVETVFDAKALACIVVTYHPDLKILARQFAVLPYAAALVIVDNASGQDCQDELIKLQSTRKRAHLIANDHNLGLASALNQGVRIACETWSDIRTVLLLDQDSEPQPGSVEALIKGFSLLKDARVNVGCVGPLLLDTASGLQHGFHQCGKWFWKRTYPPSGSTTPIPCTNLNGSGTLVSSDLFLKLGGLEEALFIDHVDTEWAFRIQAAGFGLFGIPQSLFNHRMGETNRHFWFFGWRNWPMRSPQRHYYLFRNAIIIMKRDYVPRVWKIWAILKLLLTAIIHGAIDNQRKNQLLYMGRGILDGLKTTSIK